MTRAGPAVEENSLVVGLWVHETLRVFYDRLINDEDRTWLTGLLSSMLPCQDFSLAVAVADPPFVFLLHVQTPINMLLSEDSYC